MPSLPLGNGGVTYPSPDEWTVTYVPISGISRAAKAVVTAPNHGITLAAGQNTPSVDFTQVKGMFQINGQFAYVTQVIDDNNFVVNLNTTQYYAYTSGGYVNKIAGNSPIDPLTNTFP